jgi:hypothetical protein
MNPLALLAAGSKRREPDPAIYVKAKSYGFECEICHRHYFLFLPKDFSIEQQKACQDIGRRIATEDHPQHSRQQFEIPL